MHSALAEAKSLFIELFPSIVVICVYSVIVGSFLAVIIFIGIKIIDFMRPY